MTKDYRKHIWKITFTNIYIHSSFNWLAVKYKLYKWHEISLIIIRNLFLLIKFGQPFALGTCPGCTPRLAPWQLGETSAPAANWISGRNVTFSPHLLDLTYWWLLSYCLNNLLVRPDIIIHPSIHFLLIILFRVVTRCRCCKLDITPIQHNPLTT